MEWCIRQLRFILSHLSMSSSSPMTNVLISALKHVNIFIPILQFLRLVHNFYDNDFLFNGNKKAVLSAVERRFLQHKRQQWEQQEQKDIRNMGDSGDRSELLSLEIDGSGSIIASDVPIAVNMLSCVAPKNRGLISNMLEVFLLKKNKDTSGYVDT